MEDWKLGVWFPAGTSDFSILQNAHTGFETHKSYLMCIEGRFLWCKAARE
jgi:hypothetical protein